MNVAVQGERLIAKCGRRIRGYRHLRFIFLKNFMHKIYITFITCITTPSGITTPVTQTCLLVTCSVVLTVSNTRLITILPVPSIGATSIAQASHVITRGLIHTVSNTLVCAVHTVPSNRTLCW